MASKPQYNVLLICAFIITWRLPNACSQPVREMRPIKDTEYICTCLPKVPLSQTERQETDALIQLALRELRAGGQGSTTKVGAPAMLADTSQGTAKDVYVCQCGSGKGCTCSKAS